MFPRIMVTGVPGVGKSSVTRHVSMPINVTSLEFGNLMYREGLRLGKISSLQELAALNLSERNQLQSLVVERVLKESETSTTVVDGHLVVDAKPSFVAGFPPTDLENISLTAIVVLTAPSEDVIGRRIRRGDYPEGNQPHPSRVSLHQNLTINAALFYALQHRVRIHILENVEDRLDDTVQQFLSAIEDIIQ